ncbi:MAG: hypothetical protein ACRCZD_22365 [Phycicoccus sp.]
MFKGMDVDNGRACATTLDSRAGQIDEITSALTKTLHGFEWRGPDADRTRQQWDTEQVRALASVSEALRGYSQLIGTQAQNQEEASS